MGGFLWMFKKKNLLNSFFIENLWMAASKLLHCWIYFNISKSFCCYVVICIYIMGWLGETYQIKLQFLSTRVEDVKESNRTISCHWTELWKNKKMAHWAGNQSLRVMFLKKFVTFSVQILSYLAFPLGIIQKLISSRKNTGKTCYYCPLHFVKPML